MRFCSKCGAPTDDGAAYCEKCGAKLGGASDGEAANPPAVTSPESDAPIVVAEQSFVGHYGLLLPIVLVITFWLVIPLIALICMFLSNRTYRHYVYRDRYVYEGGLLSKKRRTQTMTQVLAVDIEQSFKGKIFNFGDVRVNLIGRGGLRIEGCKHPEEVASALQGLIAKGKDIKQFVAE